MKVRAIEICRLLGGTLEGNPDALVSKPAAIEEGAEEAISFLANAKYEEFAYTCKSSVLLVFNDFQPKQAITATLIRVADVYSSLSVLLQHFQQAQQSAAPAEISPQAFVHPSAKIGKNVSIAAFSYVGAEVEIGDNCRIYPQVFLDEKVRVGNSTVLYSGVKIYKNCIIGNSCILHSNAVIGSDGFGFAPQADGSFQKIPQLGIVEIEDFVEIGSNTTIDRATLDKTLICKGVKLDNLIQIAHNVQIGEHTVVAAQTGIAGSTKVGKHCLIGGQVGLVGHISIADRTKIQAQSGLNRSIKTPDTAWYGSPAMPYNDAMRVYATLKYLPQLQKRVEVLEKK